MYEFRREPKPAQPIFSKTAEPIARKYERPPGEITDNSWQQKASCREADTGLFFKESKFGDALALCEICPVIRECRDLADVFERADRKPVGVFGGELPSERAERRRREATPVRAVTGVADRQLPGRAVGVDCLTSGLSGAEKVSSLQEICKPLHMGAALTQ